MVKARADGICARLEIAEDALDSVRVRGVEMPGECCCWKCCRVAVEDENEAALEMLSVLRLVRSPRARSCSSGGDAPVSCALTLSGASALVACPSSGISSGVFGCWWSSV